MKTKIIEVTNGPLNWGKILLGRFEPYEWNQKSRIDGLFSIIAGRGWSTNHLFMMDLQTGEGAIFLPGGFAHHDLEKHKIWVCPMFEPFMNWLWKQDKETLDDFDKLPSHLDFTQEDAPFAMTGYRRPGLKEEERCNEKVMTVYGDRLCDDAPEHEGRCWSAVFRPMDSLPGKDDEDAGTVHT